MKTYNYFKIINAMLLAFVICILAPACGKDDNNNNDSGEIWSENWLIGTWEGTTPSNIQPFGNKKIRIVFDKANLYRTESIQGNTIKTYFYDGTFTWDVGGSNWSVKFNISNYPDPGVNTINWESTLLVLAGNTTNSISLRIGDITQTDPWHSIDLDWGYVSNSKTPPTAIELYGDIEIEQNGELERADYPPNAGSMIKLTKK